MEAAAKELLTIDLKSNKFYPIFEKLKEFRAELGGDSNFSALRQQARETSTAIGRSSAALRDSTGMQNFPGKTKSTPHVGLGLDDGHHI